MKELITTYQNMKNAQTLGKALDKAWLLVLSGKVKAVNPESFIVGSYTVDIIGEPKRWICSCPQGKHYASITYVMDIPGKICKHILAVSICLKTQTRLPAPKSLYGLLCRIIDSGYSADLPWSLSSEVSVIDKELNHGPVIMLKRGKVVSEPIAEYTGSNYSLIHNSERIYSEWVGRLGV